MAYRFILVVEAKELDELISVSRSFSLLITEDPIDELVERLTTISCIFTPTYQSMK